MPKLTLRIHPSIRTDKFPEELTKEFSDVTISKAISAVLDEFPEMKDIIVENNNIKPGLLVFSEKTELTSMELMDELLDEDLRIRIVPILHGG